MKNKTMALLEKLVWFVGVAILGLSFMAVVAQAVYYLPAVPLFNPPEFNLLEQVQGLFRSLGQAFFSLLISAVYFVWIHKPKAP